MRVWKSLSTIVVAVLAAACGNGSDSGFVTASGHVEATEVRLATKIPGRIASLTLEEGDVVKAGQELARIETEDERLQLEQLGAEKDQADADLRLKRAGYRKEDIAELEAQARAIEADLEAANKDLDRMQGLLDKGSGTAKARDDATGRRDALAAKLQAARAALRRSRSGFRPEEIDAARARVDAAGARIAVLERRISDATIVSPLDAVVTEKLAEPGEWLPAGGALAVLTDVADPWLTVYVGGDDLPRIRLGGGADVVTDDGEVRHGVVTYIASTAEFTPKNVQTREEREKLVYKVKVGLENADGKFKPGMPAEARLKAEPAR